MNSPSAVQRKFLGQVNKDITFHKELVLAVYNKRNQAALETMLVEQLVLSVAARWEAFLSDLIVAYVLLNSKTAMSNMQGRILKSISDRYGAEAAKCVSFKISRKMSRSRVENLLDPKGWNVTADSADTLTKVANLNLIGGHAKKFSLTAEDATFYDFHKSLRNFLAHRSEGSKKRLRYTQSELKGVKNDDFKGILFPIGPYLKKGLPDGNTRALLFASRIVEIGNKL